MKKEETSNWFVDFLKQRAKKNKKIHSIETFDGGVEFAYNETAYIIHIFHEDEIVYEVVYGPMSHADFSVGESIWEKYEVRVEENYQDDFEDYFDNVVVEDRFKFANKLWTTLNKFRKEAETNEVESFFYDIVDSFIDANT